MKAKRGRPQSLLTRMRGEDRSEICAALKYDTRAWRFLLLRDVLRTAELPEDYFAEVQRDYDARLTAHECEHAEIWRKYRTMKERAHSLRTMRHRAPIMPPILYLWRSFIAEIGRAMMRRDDDWLQDLAKVIREGPLSRDEKSRRQFVAKVIQLFEWLPHLTVNEIYDALEKEKLADGKWKVEGHEFGRRNDVTDAIRDIATAVGVTLT
jgi:hypothetical protein